MSVTFNQKTVEAYMTEDLVNNRPVICFDLEDGEYFCLQQFENEDIEGECDQQIVLSRDDALILAKIILDILI